METNVLYYGDNLDILRRYIPAESVDLVCLDPPFNSSVAVRKFLCPSTRRSLRHGRGSEASSDLRIGTLK